jgi:hypothetical protein
VRALLRVSCGVVLAVALTARVAYADDRAEVDKARSAFLRKQYDEVERRLAPFVQAASSEARDQAVLPDAYFLLAATLFRLGRTEEAHALLDAMAARRPDAEPDPLLLPPEVVDGFADAKGRVRERVAEQQKERERLRIEAEAARVREKQELDQRIAKLENLARVESIREPHSRWVAAVPFGVGQFQNGEKGLGWVLLVSESLALLTCATTVVIYDRAIDDAYATRDQPGVSRQYLARATAARTVNVISAITGLAFGAAGLVEAQVNFVPEVKVTRERTSGELSVVLGVSGSF